MSQYYYDPFASDSCADDALKAEFYRRQSVKREKHEIRLISLSMACAIIAYLIIQFLVSGALITFGLYDLYNSNALFQYSFNVIAVSFASVAVPFGVMALVNKKRYNYPVIPTKKLGAGRAFLWICVGMMCCCAGQIAVSFIVSFFQSIFGIEFQSSETTTPDSPLTCAVSFISLAIIPAICEEFAMRCCSLQLLRKYGKGFGVAAVSIVFGILHGNVVQFIFAFTVGMILGYITVVVDSVLPAIFIHAFNNGISAVQLTINYAAGESVSSTVVSVIYIFWFAAGIAATIYLAFKKELVSKQSGYHGVLTVGQRFGAFLFPWMIVPLAILIAMTAGTIAKV